MEQHPDKVLQKRLDELLKNQKENSLENTEISKRATGFSPEKKLTEYERSQQ